MILDKLKYQQNRESTTKTYLAVWRQFNKFLLNLDRMPDTWEFRTILFVGYLIEKGMQSSTIKSYVSAIKKTLMNDNYQWKDINVELASLTKACRLKNDVVYTRLPIQCGLLELIMFEIIRVHRLQNQPYLEAMYLAMFALGYYGLMCVGELTYSKHVVKAANVHLALNKDKLLIVLYSSKTHSEANRPQKIKIVSNRAEKSGKYIHRNFCPFKLVGNYLKIRGNYKNIDEPLFIFRDEQRSPVLPEHARNVLKDCITNLGLNHELYGFHSLRIGRTSDLIKFNYTIEEVKRMGR